MSTGDHTPADVARAFGKNCCATPIPYLRNRQARTQRSCLDFRRWHGVVMLRHRHRVSKDIDIFVPDPQYLGFVSPRLSDAAESLSQDFVEGPGYIKLLRPEGEIDFVASPNLTVEPFELWHLLGRQVRVETAAEIVAKKLWHRGDRATARDLFDRALVIERESKTLESAREYLVRHREVFLSQLEQRKPVLKLQFDAIVRLDYRVTYEHAQRLTGEFLRAR